MNGLVTDTMKIIVKPRSLYLTKIWLEIKEITLEAKRPLLGIIVALLIVQNSLKNLAYGGHLLKCIQQVNVNLSLPNLINRGLMFFPFWHIRKGTKGFWRCKGGMGLVLRGSVVTVSLGSSSLDSSKSSSIIGGISEDEDGVNKMFHSSCYLHNYQSLIQASKLLHHWPS